MYNKLTEGQKSQWAESSLFCVSELRNYIFWKCNIHDPKKERETVKQDRFIHRWAFPSTKKDPNSLIVPLHKPYSVNSDLSVTDFAVKKKKNQLLCFKRKWEDLVYYSNRALSSDNEWLETHKKMWRSEYINRLLTVTFQLFVT